MPCESEQAFTEKDIPDLTGYVAIVTGGNSGIGFETAKQLAYRNARVYIASRSAERVALAIREMNESTAGKTLDLHFLQLDLQDLKSVSGAAAKFMQKESRLDILINNAGVMMTPYKLTVDGFETQWQVNTLAPQVFTMSLLPILMQTAAEAGTPDRVRVVNVVSDLAFRGPNTIQLDDVNMTDTKGMLETMHRYSHSKQATIRLTGELNNRYSNYGISAYSAHPGIVKSNLQSSDPTILGTVIRTMMKVAANTTALEGSHNSLFCATSPLAPIQGRGKYFTPVGKVETKADPWLKEVNLNDKLWKHCEAQLQRVS